VKRVDSPQKNRFYDLRHLPAVGEFPANLAGRTIYGEPNYGISLAGSIVMPNKRNIEEIVNGENFFSPLWITKDLSEAESARYCFSFDIQSFLISRSKFSGLYRKDSIAQKILGGFRARTAGSDFLTELTPHQTLLAQGVDDWVVRFLGPFAPLDILLRQMRTHKDFQAHVLKLQMHKRQVGFKQYTSGNNLGTTTAEVVQGPNKTYPEEIIPRPISISLDLEDECLEQCADDGVGKKISKYASGNPRKGVLFYHGTDIYWSEKRSQTVARYQYGTKMYVVDPAAYYIRKIADELREQQGYVRDVVASIINSPTFPGGIYADQVSEYQRDRPENYGMGLYSSHTFSTTIPLDDIILDKLSRTTSARKIMKEAILTYVGYLKELEIETSFYFGNELDDPQLPLEAPLLNMMSRPTVFSKDMELIGDAIGNLAYELENIISSEFSSDPLGGGNRNKDMLERRGTCQRKMPILEATTYFSELYEYGPENGQGYVYVENENISPEQWGLRMVGPAPYMRRAKDEFNKYFFIKDGTAPNWKSPSYVDPAVHYLTPQAIVLNGSLLDRKNQTDFVQEAWADYDLDAYASLLSDMIKVKHRSPYFNNPYYRAIKRDDTTNSENRKLFNSLIDSLEIEHACTLEEEAGTYFALPTIQRSLPAPPRSDSTSTPDADLDAGLLLAGSLFSNSAQSAGWSVSTSVQDAIQSAHFPTQNNRNQYDTLPYPTSEPPIKLTYGILGELEMDPEIRGEKIFDRYGHYLGAEFNSMMPYRMADGLIGINVKSLIEGKYASYPNQLKSMLTVARRYEYTPNLGANGFDARRTELLDENTDRELSRNISYMNANRTLSPYGLTRDPMKIYAKLAAFWLNYKQLGCIEYLCGFENTGMYVGPILHVAPWTRPEPPTLPPEPSPGGGDPPTSPAPGFDDPSIIDPSAGMTDIPQEVPSTAGDPMGFTPLAPLSGPSPFTLPLSNTSGVAQSYSYDVQGSGDLDTNDTSLAGPMLSPQFYDTGGTLLDLPRIDFPIDPTDSANDPPAPAPPPPTPPPPRTPSGEGGYSIPGGNICFGNKQKLPIWKKLTFKKIVEVKDRGQTILCRVRTFPGPLPVVSKNDETILAGDLGIQKNLSELFDMPIYDKYFLLTQDSPVFVTSQARQQAQREQAQREQAQRGKGERLSADIGDYTQPTPAGSRDAGPLSSATSMLAPWQLRQISRMGEAFGANDALLDDPPVGMAGMGEWWKYGDGNT